MDLALANRCDAYHANDWDALPIAGEAAARHGVPLVFDAHEYAPLEFGDRWTWRFLYSPAITYTLRKYAGRVAASTTVAQPIADRYRREFGLDMIAVLNAPEYQPVPSHELNPDQIRLIHHGGAIRGRRLERMIEVIARCDSRYTLHFMLTPSQPDYLDYLRAIAEQVAPGRVIFHDPVRPEQIVQEIAQYDAGFYLLEPDNYNNESALPNKLFDFINAGWPCASGRPRRWHGWCANTAVAWLRPPLIPPMWLPRSMPCARRTSTRCEPVRRGRARRSTRRSRWVKSSRSTIASR